MFCYTLKNETDPIIFFPPNFSQTLTSFCEIPQRKKAGKVIFDNILKYYETKKVILLYLFHLKGL